CRGREKFPRDRSTALHRWHPEIQAWNSGSAPASRARASSPKAAATPAEWAAAPRDKRDIRSSLAFALRLVRIRIFGLAHMQAHGRGPKAEAFFEVVHQIAHVSVGQRVRAGGEHHKGGRARISLGDVAQF